MKLGELDVSYGQIAVFNMAIEQPFNGWEPAHSRQGFAWRPGSVSFGTVSGAGAISVELNEGAPGELSPEAARIIRVPFDVDRGDVEIATIGESVIASIPPGHYALFFEHGSEPDEEMWARLWFEQSDKPVTPEILRADQALVPPQHLVMTARPGQARGESLTPLYETVPEASARDPKLYALLAVVDGIRVGGARVREVASATLGELLRR